MCGIIGYIGKEEASRIIIDGLKRLEYRGYDSAGIAVFGPDGIDIQRTEGKIVRLDKMLNERPMRGSIGVGHTRWATHGRPSEMNAHPHRSGDVIVVHNGIVENYLELKGFLIKEGFEFQSETDTEVICHLINYFVKNKRLDTLAAINKSIERLSGSYAIVVMNGREPDKLFVARKGSPMVVGKGDGESFVASDVPALLPYTREMIFLEEGDSAVLSKSGIELYDSTGAKVDREWQHIPWSPLMAEKGGYKHFMLKEIFEQVDIMNDVLAGRLDHSRGAISLPELDSLFDSNGPKFDRIFIVACGTSWHAGLVGKYMIESLSRIPVVVDLASEFRYRDPIFDEKTLVILISQSGETADTLAAEALVKKGGAKVMAICNVVGSSIARGADATLYTHAGPEIGVASTKAFTAQLVVLYLFALYASAKINKISKDELSKRVEELTTLPRMLGKVLKSSNAIKKIAARVADATHVLFIGRGVNFPVALEGALKLKEISYMHAEGFAAGELKHGPIALIESGVPVVVIAPQDATYDKVLSNVEEIRARGASVVAIVSHGDEHISSKANDVITIPKVHRCLSPMLSTIPLQLLAYYIADLKGTDVDQPRNLAKSVTVE